MSRERGTPSSPLPDARRSGDTGLDDLPCLDARAPPDAAAPRADVTAAAIGALAAVFACAMALGL